jgi:serine protease Do
VLSVPSAEQRRSLGIQHGLVVEEVRNGATRTELRSGDIILLMIHRGGQVEVKSVAQFNELLNEFKKSDSVTLLVRRGESQTFITIKGVTDK